MNWRQELIACSTGASARDSSIDPAIMPPEVSSPFSSR